MNANCIAIKTGDIHFCDTCSDMTCKFSTERRIKEFEQMQIANKSLKKDTNKRYEEPIIKVAYKGVIGKLKKLEHGYNPYVDRDGYVLEIVDAEDGHKHVFENVDLSEVKFIGVEVTL